MSRFEHPAQFESAYPHVAPSRTSLWTWLLLAALVAYAAGFVVLYPTVARSEASSAAEGNDPSLLQFVGP
jgi:hypothetical protein